MTDAATLISALRKIADTLETENRCDVHGVEPAAIRQAADYIANLAPSRAKPLEWSYEPSNGWKRGKALGLCNEFIEAIVYRTETGWIFSGILHKTEKAAKAAADEYHQDKWLAMMDVS